MDEIELISPKSTGESVNTARSHSSAWDKHNLNLEKENISDVEEVSIGQVKSSRLYKVQLEVQGRKWDAVVDLAAEVTLVSDRIYRSFTPVPTILRRCRIATAGKELSVKGFVVGPVFRRIGLRQGKCLCSTNRR